MYEIFVKIADKNVYKELKSIGFDTSYIDVAVNKFQGTTYKIFNLKPYEANILKQLCLSLGFDCAVSRDSVTCNCDITNCLIYANNVQIDNLVDKLKKQPFKLKLLADKLNSVSNNKKESLCINNTVFDWTRPYIMGILNITPDSFSDGGLYNNTDSALKRAFKIIEEGADIIDIGGESTNPNASPVTSDEEIRRIIPIIKKLKTENINIPISVDTRNFSTAKAAIEEGADIINDVSALDYDQKLFDYVIDKNIPVVIMHSDKIPASKADFTNEDIIEKIYISLLSKIEKLINAGKKSNTIIADVGIGFGKSVDSNFLILKRISEFTSLNVPLMLGISRKSFIREKYNVNFEQSDVITALYSSILKTVDIHRVHNVALTKKFLNFSKNII